MIAYDGDDNGQYISYLQTSTKQMSHLGEKYETPN
jgi:hypothetical protein